MLCYAGKKDVVIMTTCAGKKIVFLYSSALEKTFVVAIIIICAGKKIEVIMPIWAQKNSCHYCLRWTITIIYVQHFFQRKWS